MRKEKKKRVRWRKRGEEEGEEEKKQSQHVVRKLEERKKGTLPRVDSRVSR